MKELKHLNKYFVKYKGMLLLGLIITIIARLFAIVTPKLIGDSVTVVENYINNGSGDLAEVENSLLINILLLIGATTGSSPVYIFDAANLYRGIATH
jgi:ATP-binding cassette, subfamily B, multidrug efflux pump